MSVEVAFAGEDMSKYFQEWGLTEEDIAGTVAWAMENGAGFVRSDSELGEVRLVRRKVGFVNMYVEFAQVKGAIKVIDVYAHRLNLSREEGRPCTDEAGEPNAEWTCLRCGVPVCGVPDIALTLNDTDLGNIDGLRCPECKHEMITHKTVMGRMYMSEAMLAAK